MEAAAPSDTPDVTIVEGEVPVHLCDPRHSTAAWEARRGEFLLRVPEVADFLISEGRSILFKPISGCELHTIALYLVGTCFAILLQQRGELVLHASAISVGGRAVLFCGASGAGKSTLAALLCRRGYGLISDDICILTLSADDRYVVRPDGRMLKLWSNSLDFLEWRTAAQRAVRSDLDKYFVAPPGNRLAAQTVGAVYLIRDALPDEPDSLRRLRTLEGMRELRRNAYRPALVSAMDMEASYFAGSAALQVSAGIFCLSRKRDFTAADGLVELLEEHWRSLF